MVKNKGMYILIKRILDILASSLGIVILSPILLIIAVLIKLTSDGPIIFNQERIGLHGQPFHIKKFRTMVVNAEKLGKQITVEGDSRITSVGKYLRKFKLDELPQLFNVFLGEMSLVGPRPEVKKYVDMYTEEQRQVLLVRPGVTDYASIEYRNENELLAQSDNPEETYIKQVMPDKLGHNLRYIQEMSLGTDLKLIFLTLLKVFVDRSDDQEEPNKESGN
jgi:lipopolysaccharide/colanic/teichoic acid biosynthesis glycosyltransferase